MADSAYPIDPLQYYRKVTSDDLEPQKLNILPNYKYDERKIIEQIQAYIDGTYKSHYGNQDGSRIQVTEFVMDNCDNPDFLKGNIIKYAARYGRKKGYNRDDILKAVHYCIFLLHYHDQRFSKQEKSNG